MVEDYEDVGAWEEPGLNMEAERGAWDRTFYSSALDQCIGSAPQNEAERKQWVKKMTDEQRFCYNLKVNVIPQIEEIYKKSINEEGLVQMINGLVTTKYLNPAAFVLGMLASRSGRELEKTHVLEVIEKLSPELQSEYGITPPDVIRYARFWVKYAQ